MTATFAAKEKLYCKKKKNHIFHGNYIFLSVPCTQYCTGTFEPLAPLYMYFIFLENFKIHGTI